MPLPLRSLARLLASWMLVAASTQAGWSQSAAVPASPIAQAMPIAAPQHAGPRLLSGTAPGFLSGKLAAACQAAGNGWPAGWTFFEAALVASGVEEVQELARWAGEYVPRRERIARAVLREPPEHRAAKLHELLHASIFKGPYARSASDLRLVLRDGTYNCLTAAALCWDLGQAAGLDMEIWTRPGHVYLKLQSPHGPVPWEPGMPLVGGMLAAGPADSEASRALGAPPASTANPAALAPSQVLTPRQLLGRFYYNRAVDGLQAGQYADAIALLSMSLVLDPSDADARQNYLAGLNNWAVASWQRGEVDMAAQLIQQGLQLAPTYGPLRANQRLLERKF